MNIDFLTVIMPACLRSIWMLELLLVIVSGILSVSLFPVRFCFLRQWLVKIRNKDLPENASFDSLKNLIVCLKHIVPFDYERNLQHEFTDLKLTKISLLKKNVVYRVYFHLAQNKRLGYTGVWWPMAARQKMLLYIFFLLILFLELLFLFFSI